ncbi:unnamed protein product [Lasius platythorax]|uniref:Uncharacterized protein n=1 Tax=Lasius platythorax TaxID=488582 RepID=A0AAV2NQD2_9HYME
MGEEGRNARAEGGRRVMLDEDEKPVECTECVRRTCLQTSAPTETARIVPAGEEVRPRVGDTNEHMGGESTGEAKKEGKWMR